MSSNIWLRSLPLTPLLLFLYHNSLELELRGHRKGIYFYRRGNQSWELQANKQNIKDESEVLRFVMKIPKTGSRVAQRFLVLKAPPLRTEGILSIYNAVVENDILHQQKGFYYLFLIGSFMLSSLFPRKRGGKKSEQKKW